MDDQAKKPTLRDRKKAQPKAVIYFSLAEKDTIVKTVAKDLDEGQRGVFFYTCQALGLNPLLNEIACVVYKDRQTGEKTMSIQVMRDGFLTIAHRSGKFAGLESGVKVDGTSRIGWAKVYHKDFKTPVYQEADFVEYSTGKNLWVSKPNTMIKKVAESMALRKAFNVNGVYAPEEMEREIVQPVENKTLEIEGGSEPATEAQIQTLEAMKVKIPDGLTKQGAVELMREANK